MPGWSRYIPTYPSRASSTNNSFRLVTPQKLITPTMSFLPTIRAGSRRAMQTSYTIPSTSAFHTSAARRTLKENDKSKPPLPDITSGTLTNAIQTAMTCRISMNRKNTSS